MNSAKRFQRVAVPFAAAAIVLVGLLSACGSDKAEPTVAAPPAGSTSAAATSTAATATTAGQIVTPAKTQGWLKIFSGTAPAGTNAVQLTVTESPTIGKYVSDGSGRSLYRFDKDTANPPTSTCVGQCASTWPPLIVARDQALYATGVDPQRLGFLERADGTCQITVGGWPVYYFAKDTKAGDLLGQGVGGTWFAVAPDGSKTK